MTPSSALHTGGAQPGLRPDRRRHPLDAAGQVVNPASGIGSQNASGAGTVVGDPDPFYDGCASHSNPTVTMSGRSVGDLLNAKGITWGWFQGGFRPTTPFNPGAGVTKAVCASSHKNVAGTVETDYSPHHNPFEYYASTANPHHLPPTSERMIG
jgi:phospholipase C